MLNVWIDGACEIMAQNTASYGLVVKRGETPLIQTHKVIGHGQGMSNNVAEYGALLAFFSWYSSYAKEYDNSDDKEHVIIHSDSQLLINQMNRKWKATSGMYLQYYKSALLLTQDYKNIEFKWIPREENTEADALSKRALYDIGIVTK